LKSTFLKAFLIWNKDLKVEWQNRSTTGKQWLDKVWSERSGGKEVANWFDLQGGGGQASGLEIR
jgi:hypothetical protein